MFTGLNLCILYYFTSSVCLFLQAAKIDEALSTYFGAPRAVADQGEVQLLPDSDRFWGHKHTPFIPTPLIPCTGNLDDHLILTKSLQIKR